jgi:hypothetical protein
VENDRGELMKQRVYFHLGLDRPVQADAHALAQGLKSLGIRAHAGVDWWFETPNDKETLFVHDPDFNPANADIIICTKASYRGFNERFQPEIHGFPEWLMNRERKFRLVYIEDEDGYEALSWYPPFTEFDLVLRTKMNRRGFAPPNFRPWQLGVSDHVIKRAGEKLQASSKKLQVLLNFNATHPFEHPLRRLAKDRIIPRFEEFMTVDRTVAKWQGAPTDSYDAFHLQQAGQFFNPFYHDFLAESAACFAFCGELIPGLPFNPAAMLRGGNKARLKRALWSEVSKVTGAVPRAIQWDSYRFWECLAFACCPVHLDLEKYGVELPVMPENWTHYIGLDLDNLEADLDRIKQSPDILLEIGRAGRAWLIENYSAQKVAKRFLECCSLAS